MRLETNRQAFTNYSKMEISLNWLKNYVDLGDLDPVKIGEILTDIGLEVEGMETVDAIKGVKTGSSGFHQDVPTEDVVIERAEII